MTNCHFVLCQTEAVENDMKNVQVKVFWADARTEINCMMCY